MSTLSGDVGLPGVMTDNAFHVVYIDRVSDTMRLDGFIIRDGFNFDGTGLETYGAGIFNNAEAGRSHPTIVDCMIRSNRAAESGGGLANYASFGGKARPTLISCRFFDNEGSGGGAMMNLTDSDGEISPTLISCFLQGNTARSAQGSAINTIVHSGLSTVRMINCVLTGNHCTNGAAYEAFVTGTGISQTELINCVFAGNNNGSIRISDIGLRTSTLLVRNSIMYNNGFGHGMSFNGATEDVQYCIIEFGYTGEGNLPDDPMLIEMPSSSGTPHMEGNVRLQLTSPAIDAGRNDAVPVGIDSDAAGQARFVDSNTGEAGGVVDIGAFELQEAIISGITDVKLAEWQVYPNPAADNVQISFEESDIERNVSLWNASGQLMQNQHTQYRLNFHVAAFPRGVYYVMVSDERSSEVRKILLQ
jgi:hypothetical protein